MDFVDEVDAHGICPAGEGGLSHNRVVASGERVGVWFTFGVDCGLVFRRLVDGERVESCGTGFFRGRWSLC